MARLVKEAKDVSGNLVIFLSTSGWVPYLPTNVMHLLQDSSLLALLHFEVKSKMNSC